MRKLEHQNIVKLKYFFYSSGDKVSGKVVSLLFSFFHATLIDFSNNAIVLKKCRYKNGIINRNVNKLLLCCS